jgi:hypothetical protein
MVSTFFDWRDVRVVLLPLQLMGSALQLLLYTVRNQHCSIVNLLDPSGIPLGLLWLVTSSARDSARTLYARLTPYTPRLSTCIVSGAKCHRSAIYEHLILSVVYPVPADHVGRITAGWVMADHVPKADVISKVHAASSYPSQAVDTNIRSVEPVAPVSRLEEWPQPQLAPILLNLKVAEELASLGGISKPQFEVLDRRSHRRFDSIRLLKIRQSRYTRAGWPRTQLR